MFQNNVMPPSSGLNSKPSKKPGSMLLADFLRHLLFDPKMNGKCFPEALA
jgi:hypothetical protein